MGATAGVVVAHVPPAAPPPEPPNCGENASSFGKLDVVAVNPDTFGSISSAVLAVDAAAATSLPMASACCCSVVSASSRPRFRRLLDGVVEAVFLELAFALAGPSIELIAGGLLLLTPELFVVIGGKAAAAAAAKAAALKKPPTPGNALNIDAGMAASPAAPAGGVTTDGVVMAGNVLILLTDVAEAGDDLFAVSSDAVFCSGVTSSLTFRRPIDVADIVRHSLDLDIHLDDARFRSSVKSCVHHTAPKYPYTCPALLWNVLL